MRTDSFAMRGSGRMERNMVGLQESYNFALSIYHKLKKILVGSFSVVITHLH